ncbi:glycosyl transferase group 1 [Desulfofarcimen acetoxidans DSM 771]|uniref:Glycosyl transferase group 1 n=2 Tax=Desulfofarcimen acetoxidans TaxID=58138 RepID=C8VYP8_DESAS|nr:glycosyl transferase group 1 [Desulfofarcimen acetoxidans DSM 771]
MYSIITTVVLYAEVSYINSNSEMRIATIVNSIGDTSMPYNEFVMYRNSEELLKCKQLVISFKGEQEYEEDLVTVKGSNNSIITFFRNLRLLNEGDIVHIHNSHVGVLYFFLSLFLRQRNRVLFTIHSMFERYTVKVKLFTLLCIALSDEITLVSKAAYLSLPQIIKNIFNKKITIITNGVNCKKIESFINNMLNKSKKHDNFTVVCVGRLVKEKNQKLLLKILLRLPDVQLKIIGNGYLYNELINYCCEKKIANRVCFLGEISREDVYKEIIKCHLFVSTSTYEGLPIAVLEALYLGMPAVLSDIAPHVEIKEKLDNVDVVDIDTIDNWLPYFSFSYINSYEELNNIFLIKKCFSLDKMHDEYNKLYFRLRRSNYG